MENKYKQKIDIKRISDSGRTQLKKKRNSN